MPSRIVGFKLLVSVASPAVLVTAAPTSHPLRVSPAPKVVYPWTSVLEIPGAELGRFPVPSGAQSVQYLQSVVAS